MDIFSVIFVFVFSVVASFVLYGIWKVENDRYEFRNKHGIDPKYHGWIVKDKEENDENQGEGKK
jgi:hypothetical protein